MSLEDVIQWETEHRHPDYVGPRTAAVGFGWPRALPMPPGISAMTLYLPSPPAAPSGGMRFRFEQGRRVALDVPEPVQPDPELHRLAVEVLESFEQRRAGIAVVTVAFVDYAAALLRKGYAFPDDDLADLLTGDGWHDGVLRHMLGGRAMVEKLAALAVPRPTSWAAPLPLPPTRRPITPVPAAEKPAGILARLRKLATNE